jgi:sugar O-acyltransferase (sialic acid O-acetyltransferase NeuD family)
MTSILIYGAGGFGQEVACLLKVINQKNPTWDFLGFVDDGIPAGTRNAYGEVLGDVTYVNDLETPTAVVIAIASSGIIMHITQKITNKHIFFPNIIAPDVLFFDKDSFNIGQGNLITFGCRMSCNVEIGNFNILNGQVSFGHDVTIGNYNVIMPETRISGESHIGNSNFFGVRSLVLQGIKIGTNTRIGAASVVMRNTKDDSLYIGNPAKKTEI